ncbi:MAG: hypothetical protein HQL14_06305 [Candidatus Omnitrophica bacterium]|nr:hypothetical protein [Candidatus Omnitrophota bacterium]
MYNKFRKTVALITATAFLLTTLVPVLAYAQMTVPSNMPWMPTPGERVLLSFKFTPSHLVGITIHPDNALQFDFLIHKGDGEAAEDQKQDDYKKLIKYFLASLTVPDSEQWVNLSPYENDRIISGDFGKTEMGRDLLAQDYILKQITSSLMYPEEDLGKKFWDRIYQRAQKAYGRTDIPVNTFNKVWIVPDEAVVYESGNTAYILKSHMKVMMEEDYLSLEKHSAVSISLDANRVHTLASQIVKEIILPELEKEINEGKNFAPLRQIYSGMILAAWYKKALKESLLGQVYADKSRVKGVDQDPQANEEIYQRYLRAFKKGVFNYIKEDMDTYTQQPIPRKYFSGGFVDNAALVMKDIHGSSDLAQLTLAEQKSLVDAAIRVDPTSIVTVKADIASTTDIGALVRPEGVGVDPRFGQMFDKINALVDSDFPQKRRALKFVSELGVSPNTRHLIDLVPKLLERFDPTERLSVIKGVLKAYGVDGYREVPIKAEMPSTPVVSLLEGKNLSTDSVQRDPSRRLVILEFKTPVDVKDGRQSDRELIGTVFNKFLIEIPKPKLTEPIEIALERNGINKFLPNGELSDDFYKWWRTIKTVLSPMFKEGNSTNEGLTPEQWAERIYAYLIEIKKNNIEKGIEKIFGIYEVKRMVPQERVRLLQKVLGIFNFHISSPDSPKISFVIDCNTGQTISAKKEGAGLFRIKEWPHIGIEGSKKDLEKAQEYLDMASGDNSMLASQLVQSLESQAMDPKAFKDRLSQLPSIGNTEPDDEKTIEIGLAGIVLNGVQEVSESALRVIAQRLSEYSPPTEDDNLVPVIAQTVIPHSEIFVQRLMSLLQNESLDWAHRKALVDILGDMGEFADAAVPLLKELDSRNLPLDRNPNYSKYIRDIVLAKIGTLRAINHLVDEYRTYLPGLSYKQLMPGGNRTPEDIKELLARKENVLFALKNASPEALRSSGLIFELVKDVDTVLDRLNRSRGSDEIDHQVQNQSPFAHEAIGVIGRSLGRKRIVKENEKLGLKALVRWANDKNTSGGGKELAITQLFLYGCASFDLSPLAQISSLTRVEVQERLFLGLGSFKKNRSLSDGQIIPFAVYNAGDFKNDLVAIGQGLKEVTSEEPAVWAMRSLAKFGKPEDWAKFKDKLQPNEKKGLDEIERAAAAHELSEEWRQDFSRIKRVIPPTPALRDKSMMSVAQNGGIDLNAANLDLQIKRDGRGVPLPLDKQDINQIGHIEGFVPVIIEIKPLTNLPFLSELQHQLQSSSASSGGA